MRVLNLKDIKSLISQAPKEMLIQCIEDSFTALSTGLATMPPVGHLGFDSPPGDMHIKYGYIKNDPYYVIKIASGFYENHKVGLPNNNGMMLVFDAKTGKPECLLQDQGYLTDLRTALAGAVVAKHLGPANIQSVGVLGTGVQARMQLEMLQWVTDFKEVYAYGRSNNRLKDYQSEMSDKGFKVHLCKSPAEVAANTQLIVTTTASQQPLLHPQDIVPGTHITAMGADAPGKQELDPLILKEAALIICDSKEQCLHHGECGFAVKENLIGANQVIELGEVITNSFKRSENDITVADLTGVATQDIKIASLVMNFSNS